MQVCAKCNRMQYPPEPRCRQCGEKRFLEWREVEGRGRIYEYCVMYDSRKVAFHPIQPFNQAVIKLNENPEILMFGTLPETPPDEVPVDAEVEVIWLESETGQLIPDWRVIGKQNFLKNEIERRGK
jgi:hypothetical protein